MPRVTIGLPTFNRAILLKRAIEQVLSQTFTDFEFIIYNDGSIDETVNVVKSFNDSRIIFIDEINKGLPQPLNIILELARGEYIIILHDHDKFNPQLIEKSVNALDENPSAGFVLQACAWINSDEVTGYQEFILDLPLINEGRIFGEDLLLKTNGFSSPIHACCMVRRNAYEKVGKYYDEKFGWYTDVDLWLRLLKDFKFIYFPEVLFVFTGREQNHLLNKKVWQVSKWQHDIFLENTIRYFESDAQKYVVQKKISEKIKKSNLLNLIAVLVSNDLDLLKEGYDYLKNSENFLFTKIIIKSLHLSDYLTVLIMKTSSQINRLRKMLLNIRN
jgi:glycosyltransferase involved in cell wall biosynthesis